jgi:hypothetical protein
MKFCGVSRSIPVALAGLVIGVGAAAGAAPVLVTAKVPEGASVSSLRGGAFKQTVTCRQTCKVTTSVGIHSKLAKQLGFTGVNTKEPWFEIAKSSSKLKAAKPTKMSFALSTQAKKLLPKAKSGLQVLGVVRAVPVAKPSTNVSVTWITTLS